MKTIKAPRWGIRRRLLFFLALFVALVLALLWVFQISLLDTFYMAFRTRDIEYCATLIERNLEHEQLNVLVGQLSERYDTCILMLDENGRIVMDQAVGGFCLIHRMRERELSAIAYSTA